MYFGFRDLLEYSIGDEYHWRPGKSYKNGGRPPDGNDEGDAYGDCDICKKDFFAKVIIQSDRIVGVKQDAGRPGYCPD